MPEKSAITPHVRRKAAKLAKNIRKWARRDPQTGLTHYYVPATEQEPGEMVRVHKVDILGRACSCPANRSRSVCAHAVAAQLVAQTKDSAP